MARTISLVKKVCLIGDPGVGKTSLVRRFVKDIFDDKYLTTIGAKVTKKDLELDVPELHSHVNLGLMIWDVAGHKEHELFHEMYLRGVEGALIVADITRRSTFFSLKGTMAMIDRNAAGIPMIFLLNKCDLAEPNPNDLNELRKIVSKRNIPALVTSAKTGMNVQLAFEELGRSVVEEWIKKSDEKRESMR